MIITSNYGIYKITNLINNKIYIGSSKNIKKRFKDHIKLLRKNKHHSIKLQRSWNKYGRDNFLFEQIEDVPTNSQLQFLLDREQYYLDLYDTASKGYNISKKSTGLSYSDKMRNKHFEMGCKNNKPKVIINPQGEKIIFLSKKKLCRDYGLNGGSINRLFNGGLLKHKGWHLENPRISKPKGTAKYWLGKTHSNKTKRKMSENRQGVKNSFFGKTHTIKTIDKLSKIAKKKYQGKNNPMYGKFHTNETKNKISESRIKNNRTRTILNSTGEIITFNNLRKLCRDYNLNRGSLMAVLRRDQFQHKGWKNVLV